LKTLKIGICGHGGLGHLHSGNLARMKDVEVVAVCDNDPKQLEPKEVATNLQSGGSTFDIRECRTYTDCAEMLDKEELDAVVTALPTDLHAKYAVMALQAGVHVFSEKPMALTLKQCDQMIAARDAAKRQLMVGQCLRFWPEYEALRETIADKRLGKLLTMSMTRVGGYAGWASENWFNDGERSGGAILDLHLHDVDWAVYALGLPKAICASGLVGNTGAVDDVAAVWLYDGFQVAIRGSWMFQGFSMSFQAGFESGQVDFGVHPDPAYRVKRAVATDWEKPELCKEGGHFNELVYFFECVRGEHANTACTAESTRDSIRLVELENQAIKQHKWIEVKGE